MELDALKSMWNTNEAKLEDKLTINEANVVLIQTKKAASKLRPLYIQRIVEAIFHAIAIALLLGFLYQNIFQLPYALSSAVLTAFYVITFLNALKQIILIRKMDYNKDLVTLQSALVLLQTHIVNYAKLVLLFVPAFLSYPVVFTKVIKDLNIKWLAGFDIIAQSNGNWWTVQIIVFALFIPAGAWFFKEITYKNIDKKWVRDFIQRSSGKSVAKALAFLKELQSLKKS